LKNITQKEIFVHSLGLFGSSKLTAKAVVIALVAGLLGVGLAVSSQEPANATSCGSGSSSATYSGGDGTSTTTAFRISTTADLIRISKTSADWTGKYFIQTADIDLAGCEWDPIGRSTQAFSGFYDGGGFAISGLSITNRTQSFIGLFSYVRNSRIENLTVRGVISILNGAQDVFDIGGVAGSAAGGVVISKVRSEVSITSTRATRTGGLTGEFAGTIEYSSYQGNIHTNKLTSLGYAGGLVATLAGAGTKIVNSFARASFSGDSLYMSGLTAGGNLVIDKSYSASSGVKAAFSGEGSLGAVNSFWDSELAAGVNPKHTNADPIVNVVGKTTLQMKDVSTFSAGVSRWSIVDGWEAFSTSAPAKIWGICSRANDGYPFLLWEYTTDPCTVAPPPSNSDSGSSSGSVYVAPVVVPEVVPVVPSTIRQTTIRKATEDKPARLLGRSLDKDVLFIADSARLSPEAKKNLRQAARLAMASDGKVAVTGFAAMTNRGSAYEKSVAQKRALAVARYLRAQGFDDWIYYQGLSGRQGLAFDGDPRRVEIRILK
jgi:outer membrane protein OmpA-like peptidoglycan-associated protein